MRLDEKFTKASHPKWLRSYAKGKKSEDNTYAALIKLLRRFTSRTGFSQRTSHSGDRYDFSAGFWEKYGHYAPSDIYNVDETGIWYDIPPKRI
ncbi:hypothetical protein JG687_00018559 [Phytophthora cactorum]|uniref:Uncharacterized protein n=1 Tax=Phytophthora cactorum TaxID=29920 RepID=A0A329RBC0_9STRA|nr:hypothetical protein JG687_00018559 [Phytophthora cactorum]RAW21740.1 hypothetical protein PC110_g21817 [Phytophthora cactorum]